MHNVSKIMFGGFFIRGRPFTMHTITYAINFWVVSWRYSSSVLQFHLPPICLSVSSLSVHLPPICLSSSEAIHSIIHWANLVLRPSKLRSAVSAFENIKRGEALWLYVLEPQRLPLLQGALLKRYCWNHSLCQNHLL